MKYEVFPFEIHGDAAKNLFIHWLGCNRSMMDEMFGNVSFGSKGRSYSWRDVEIQVFSPTEAAFQTFYDDKSQYDEDSYRSYHERRREDELLEVVLFDGELEKFVEQRKMNLAEYEFERREKIRLEIEYQAKILAIRNELFGNTDV